MLYIIGLTLSLTAFWLLMSGIYTPLILFLGFVSVVFVLYLTRRMDALDEDCLLYTSPSPRDLSTSRMPSSA